MNSTIKLILADDQILFRNALKLLIRERRMFDIIGEAANGKDLLDLLKVKRPDVILLDIEMPVMDGRAALEVIRNRYPLVKVIVLSYFDDATYLSEFMARGANAYLSKGCEVNTLFDAIKKVHKEGVCYNDTVSSALLSAVRKGRPLSKLESQLNEKEIAIVRMICNGKTNKEIAKVLFLSPATIDFHRSKIYTKTNCCNVAELFHYALRKNLLRGVA